MNEDKTCTCEDGCMCQNTAKELRTVVMQIEADICTTEYGINTYYADITIRDVPVDALEDKGSLMYAAHSSFFELLEEKKFIYVYDDKDETEPRLKALSTRFISSITIVDIQTKTSF